MGWQDQLLSSDTEEAAIKPRRKRQDTEMDMTPMIDCTFLLLIFFTVGSKMETGAAARLPPARFGVAMNPQTAVIVTAMFAERDGAPAIFLGDGDKGVPLPKDTDEQTRLVREELERALSTAPVKNQLLIKADRRILWKDIRQIAKAATDLEGMTLYVAVFEGEK